jgi:hypothetical protein
MGFSVPSKRKRKQWENIKKNKRGSSPFKKNKL